MRLFHKTQRGGEITHTGQPLPPGQTVTIPVDKRGFLKVPDPELGRHLLRVLAPDLVEVPENTKEEE